MTTTIEEKRMALVAQCMEVARADCWRSQSLILAEPNMIDPNSLKAIEQAIAHAVNYHSLDARLGMADHAIATLIAPEVRRHLEGKTDVQVMESMSPERRAAIGREH